MNIYRIIIILITLMILISACTEKKNSVGFQPGIEPKVIEFDYNYFGDFISFEDSTGNYYNNSKLLIGNYFSSNYENKAFTLLRIIGLPDTIMTLESAVTVHLEKSNSHNFDDISNETLKLGKIGNLWLENQATWFNATDSTGWSDESGFSENDYELIEFNNVEVMDDSIYLELPDELLLDWVENDSLNFGITVFTDQEDSFLELLSAESESAYLSFSYTTAASDTTIEYKQKFTSDTFIYATDNEFQIFNNEMKVSNIQPVKLFLEFDISDSAFINIAGSGIENSDDYRRMTINKAELILSPADYNSYPVFGTVAVVPYMVTADTLNLDDLSRPMLIDEEYESFYDGTSSDSVNANINIDLKYIIQYITAGERENKGIIIESIYEDKDFLNVSFTDTCDPNVENRPKLRIIYTPPYLDE